MANGHDAFQKSPLGRRGRGRESDSAPVDGEKDQWADFARDRPILVAVLGCVAEHCDLIFYAFSINRMPWLSRAI